MKEKTRGGNAEAISVYPVFGAKRREKNGGKLCSTRVFGTFKKRGKTNAEAIPVYTVLGKWKKKRGIKKRGGQKWSTRVWLLLRIRLLYISFSNLHVQLHALLREPFFTHKGTSFSFAYFR